MGCDSFPVSTLSYSPYSSKPDSNMICLAIGALALFFFLMKNNNGIMAPYYPSPQYYSMVQRPVQHAAAMVSSVGRAVSARLAETVETVTGAEASVIDASASKDVDNIPEAAVQLIDAPKCASEKDAWKSMTEGEKKSVEKVARKFIKTHDKISIMFFAPWCSHCHAAAPAFAAASGQVPEVPCVMINAESLPREAFQGADAIWPLEYFPTFVVKDASGMHAVASPEEGVAQLSEEGASAMLGRLF